MADRFDFAVFGSGFGGSIMSMVLRRLGLTVLLVEKGRHPRFAIGESSTPFSNLLLETIAGEFDLPALRPLCEWGSWQKVYPEIPCGLKRGFTFYHHRPGESFDLNDQESRLLVAASPNDPVADTHWYRPSLDAFLVREAEALGVQYLEHATVRNLRQANDQWEFEVETTDGERKIAAGMIIDATGARSVLAREFGIRTADFDGFPVTCSVFAHFQNVRPWSLQTRSDVKLPYRPEDAAVHHVFKGGWIWVLQFNNGITSAGAALEQTKRAALNQDPAAAWNELLAEFPSLGRAFAEAVPVAPFYGLDTLSFRRAAASGRRWVMIPAAAGFVDPLLSTGFALNLLGVLRIGRALRQQRWAEYFEEYERLTLSELDTTAQLIAALYSKMGEPRQFNLLTLIYFAAMSYTETAWRLRKPELASGFLLNDHADFQHELLAICSAAKEGADVTLSKVLQLIKPFDIAGLARSDRNNVYPVSLEDLFSSAGKLQANRADIAEMLERCGIGTSELSRDTHSPAKF